MKPKFKVGDKVKVKSFEDLEEQDHGLLFKRFIKVFGGQRFVVKQTRFIRTRIGRLHFKGYTLQRIKDGKVIFGVLEDKLKSANIFKDELFKM